MNHGSIMGKRAGKALTIVISAILAIPCIDALTSTKTSIQPIDADIPKIVFDSADFASDPMTTLENLARRNSPNERKEAAVLHDELFIPSDSRDVRTCAGETVVSYVVDKPINDALEQLQSGMESLGWSGVPLGNGAGVTFLKQGGSCTWTLATCTQTAQSTTVVFRSVIS